MKRKTSTSPTCVYKYALLPPVDKADLVEQSFEEARRHYNLLVQIEHERRYRYRSARSRLFPEMASREESVRELEVRAKALREVISVGKSSTRTRAVDAEAKMQLATVVSELRTERTSARKLRESIASSPEMQQASDAAHELANQSVKALRPTLYWGTYLLNEASIKQAAGSPKDPSYNTDPPHLLANRIGVHLCGGLGVAELSTSTLVQISPMPIFHTRPSGKVFARGKAARTTLKFRVGSEGTRKTPIFAVFPMIMDRPLPDDARIKDAYVTRRPHSIRQPWRYDLCIVLETDSRESKQSIPGQVGLSAVNFGWRLLGGELRVATVQGEDGQVQEIRLPEDIVGGFAKCDELQSLLADKFNEAKSAMSAWLSSHEVSEPFREAFASVSQWRSQHRLAEVVQYWISHRVKGDSDIFLVMNEWLNRYRHLGDWERHFGRHLLDRRKDLYRVTAKRLATSSATIVMDMSDFSELAKNPLPEEEKTGGDEARRNRMIAAPGEFRQVIIEACKKYHCEVVAVESKNNTKRCNECGRLCVWDQARELEHACPCGHVWDQDVNHTSNALEKVASGEVVTLVTPAKLAKTGEIVSGEALSMGTARGQLSKIAK